EVREAELPLQRSAASRRRLPTSARSDRLFDFWIFGLVPIASQPVGYQSNCFCIKNFIIAVFLHAVVVLAIVALLLGIANHPDEPFARAVAGQVRPGGLFVLFVKL